MHLAFMKLQAEMALTALSISNLASDLHLSYGWQNLSAVALI
jgi:hypothetical protein